MNPMEDGLYLVSTLETDDPQKVARWCKDHWRTVGDRIDDDNRIGDDRIISWKGQLIAKDEAHRIYIAACEQRAADAFASAFASRTESLNACEASLATAQARIAELEQRLKIPHPARDFVNEFNDLLASKDARIAELERELQRVRGET